MQIAIRRDNFSIDCYELQIQDAVLEFVGNSNKFSLPYIVFLSYNHYHQEENK